MNWSELAPTDVVGLVIAGIVGLTAFIEIVPIKLNHWSWLFKKIGKAVNAELVEKVNQIEDNLLKLKAENEQQTAKDNRSAILRFGDELRMGIKHSKESFDNILITISDYDHYCETHTDFRNRITEINEKFIADTFDDCLRNNEFL